MDIEIRKGKKEDLSYILLLIKELADYENSLDQVTLTLDQLEKDGFCDQPNFYFIVAVVNDEIIGMSFYWIRYSTWKGKFLFLEDFVVKESFRRNGVGSRLFEETIRIAKDEKMNGMFWQVLDWNTPAIDFYKKYNADISSGWLNGKLNDEQIKSFKF
jgi:GNAT superfamily N-acetyltransferase|tara:strand:- start:168 stop:641 length:474 start_codon:yes stop_codon:yes gene_type:complete